MLQFGLFFSQLMTYSGRLCSFVTQPLKEKRFFKKHDNNERSQITPISSLILIPYSQKLSLHCAPLRWRCHHNYILGQTSAPYTMTHDQVKLEGGAFFACARCQSRK